MLSPTAPALRTQCLGGQVARFLKPFEARPADPVRRELYRQLAEKPGIAATSGWLAPSEALASTPAPLGPGTEECASRALPRRKGGGTPPTGKRLPLETRELWKALESDEP